MAIVVVAHDTVLGVDRAIKLLTPHGGARATLRRRLKAEARAMARLHHPNILSIHDVGEEGDLDYVVMDLAGGGSLQDKVEQGVLTPSQAVQYTIQTLSALAAAHAAGVVHRDVKPHNVLLDNDGRALLADFGIALLTGDDRRTKSGVAMGSLAFMPPEQRLDAAGVGPSADIYSAGSTLFNMLTGTNPVDLFLAADDSKRWERVPPTLKPIIQRACAMSPGKRWETAGDMARALMGVLDQFADDTDADGPLAPAFPSPSHAFTDGQGLPHGPTNATMDAVSFIQERIPASAAFGLGPSAHGTVTSDDSSPLGAFDIELPHHPTLPVGPAPSDGWVRFAPAGMVAMLLCGLVVLALWAVPATEYVSPVTEVEVPEKPTPEQVEPVGEQIAPEPELPEPEPPLPEPLPQPDPIQERIEPTPVPVQEVAGSSAVTGSWTGSSNGIFTTVTLRGSAASIRGTIESHFRGNAQTFAIAGTLTGQTLTLIDTDEARAGAARYEFNLAGDRLEGKALPLAGGIKPLSLKRVR